MPGTEVKLGGAHSEASKRGAGTIITLAPWLRYCTGPSRAISEPFPFSSHRTMADVLRDEARK
jgi:hypothetical protein